MQWLGVAPILGSWIVAAVLLTRWRGHKGMSISAHGATTNCSYLLFALTLTLYALSYGTFAFSWLIPRLQLPPVFGVAASLAVACLLATAWIRDNNGGDNRKHGTPAYSMAALMAVQLGIIAASPTLSLIVRGLLIATTLYMIIAFYLFFFVPRVKPYYLWFQGGYVLSFQLSILAIIAQTWLL